MIKINNINTSNLDSIGLSQTSKGVLLKWNDKDYYYKSGSLRYGLFDKVSPVVECICSQIRDMLGLEGAIYTLQNINTKGSYEFEKQEILCCVSKNFLKEEETLVTFGKHYKNIKDKLTYEKIIDEFKEFEKKHVSQIKLIKNICLPYFMTILNYQLITNLSMKMCFGG